MLPRLTRMWTHLEKFRGGIGMRGPGETQLETDRRLIGHRIRLIKERLEQVQRSREVQRAGRETEFRAALVGYTNAGKSSVLRGLSGQEVFVEDRLFATLDPLTREVSLGQGLHALVTDTVGFVRKLPHQLVASFRATLEEARDADLLLHVVDASHPQWEEQRAVVEEVVAEVGAGDVPVLYVLNKVDRLGGADEAEHLAARLEREGLRVVTVSAVTDGGLAPLSAALASALQQARRVVDLRVPVSDGRTIATVRRLGEVLSEEYDGETAVHPRGARDAGDQAVAAADRDRPAAGVGRRPAAVPLP
jgi:GTP-binding protein HflX